MDDSKKPNQEQNDASGLNRRGALKRMLGASALLFSYPLSTKTWGQPASPFTGASGTTRIVAGRTGSSSVFSSSMAPAYKNYSAAPSYAKASVGASRAPVSPQPRMMVPTMAPIIGGGGMTAAPTMAPIGGGGATSAPTMAPIIGGGGMTAAPTMAPIGGGGITSAPTMAPIGGGGMTSAPTMAPIGGGGITSAPTMAPIGGGGMTSAPTMAPIGGGVTSAPTMAPIGGGGMTAAPTMSPVASPTLSPTQAPINVGVTAAPTMSPIASPTMPPTQAPVNIGMTAAPTMSPIASPTMPPTQAPVNIGMTAAPTMSPIAAPTLAPVALPVELVEFTGEISGSTVKLKWRTEAEINNKGFELQRSTTSSNFRKINWQAGAGSVSSPQSYSYDDDSIRPGKVYYYRLKQIDHNSTFEYSEVLVFVYEQEEQFNVRDLYPNPANGGFVNVTILTKSRITTTIIVSDMTGKLMINNKSKLSVGENLVKLNLSSFSSGTYTVRIITSKGDSHTKQLVITK